VHDTPLPATSQKKLPTQLIILRTDFVSFRLFDEGIDVRKTFLAFRPRLELVTNILTPGIRKTPAKHTNNGVEVLALVLFGESAHDRSLYKPMD